MHAGVARSKILEVKNVKKHLRFQSTFGSRVELWQKHVHAHLWARLHIPKSKCLKTPVGTFFASLRRLKKTHAVCGRESRCPKSKNVKKHTHHLDQFLGRFEWSVFFMAGRKMGRAWGFRMDLGLTFFCGRGAILLDR